MSSISRLLTTLVALGLLTFCGPLRFASGQDDVAAVQLVDSSAAVFLEVPHLEATWSRLQKSRLLTRLKAYPPIGRFLGGAGFQKWTQVEEHVRRTTGKALSEHLVGVFSESLVLAVYLPEGKAPQGVLIGKARDPIALKQALQAWGALEPQQVSRTKEHRGHSYVQRAKSADSKELVYYATFGKTIALSDQEALIQQVIEFHQEASRTSAAVAEGPRVLSDLTLYQGCRSRLPAESAAYLFLNPRMWDRVVDETVRKSADAEGVRVVLQNVTAFSASLRLDDEVVVDMAVDVNGKSLPEGWRKFISSTKEGGDWLQRIPAQSVIAVSSRLQVDPLVRGWLAVTPETKTDDFARGRNLLKSVLLGSDLFTTVGPRLLRDWTVSLNAVDGAASGQSPLDVVGRFWLEGAGESGGIPVERTIDNGLQFGMTALAAMISHQRSTTDDPVIVESESTDSGVTRILKGLHGWSPGYEISSQQLLVATSRQALLDSRGPRSENSNARLATARKRYFPVATQLVWLDAVRLRAALSGHGSWIAARIAPNSTGDRERLLKHLSKIEETSRLFDAAFLAAGFDEDRVRIVFGAALDRSE